MVDYKDRIKSAEGRLEFLKSQPLNERVVEKIAIEKNIIAAYGEALAELTN